MKAVVIEEFGGVEVLKLKDIEEPKPKPNEVIIAVSKTSLNFADIKNRTGKKAKGEFPLILGLDAAGIVVEVGEQVKSISVGQRVIAFPSNGSYTEYVVADEKLVFPIPDNMDMLTAAACPIVSFLSYALLKYLARIQEGESVLIHSASGGVGTTAIQLARIFGAKQIFGSVGNIEKEFIAIDAGADEVFTYENFVREVKERTDGQGVNVILDSVGGTVSEQSMNCLANYGRLIHFGNSSGKPGTFLTNQVHASCRSVLGFSLGTTRKERPEYLKHIADSVIPLISKGDLRIKIGHVFELSEISNAHALMENRMHSGKIIINVNDSIK
ncbi:quinone oxidoreductase family protein [Geobacillus sp. YF-1]|uniref:quinone oxidoreductase family protein n=1 Tax=Geobacillus sp. YF-1 TaxID=3457480 RepID=UPI0040459B01